MAMVAQDNFVAEVDGAPVSVQKGQVFPDKHAVVKLDSGRGVLFRHLDEEPDAPKRRRPTATRGAGAPPDDGADSDDTAEDA